jgi:phosphoribosylformylglycinamidine synthase
MGQFVGCLQGISEACRALDFPVVSGNVSLYNETQGRGILPTPTIGGVGVLADFTKNASIAFKGEGEAVVLIGDTEGWLGRSVYLWAIEGREEGAPPPVDLTVERRNGDFVSSVFAGGRVTAVHDLSDGGLAVALAEMALAGNVGVSVEALPRDIPAHAALFGEDQARYLVALHTADASRLIDEAAALGIPALRIGTTGGDEVVFGARDRVALSALRSAHEEWLPSYMAAAAE